jgi:hypothetical protein
MQWKAKLLRCLLTNVQRMSPMTESLTTVTERGLAIVGKFFSAARIVKVPLAMTAMGAGLLVALPQAREVYRVIAQDMWYGLLFRCAGNVFTIECPHFALLREALFAYLGLLAAALAIWYAGCRVASTFWPTSPEARLERSILRLAPAGCAFTLIIAGAWGIYSSIPFHPNGDNASILKAIAQHKSAANYGAQADAHVDAMLRLINFLILPTGIMEAMAGLLVVTAVCILIFGPRLLHPRDMVPATRWELQGPLLAFLGLLVIFLAMPVTLPRWIGPIGVLGLFLTCTTLILTQLSAFSSRYQIPCIFLLFCWAILLSWTGVNNNHVVSLASAPAHPDNPQVGTRRALKDVLVDWYDSRPDRAKYEKAGRPYPVYVVAAQGGGIYAAYDTARLLGSLQDRCPAFAWHNFAISGVSGGSVGASVFVSLLQRKEAALQPNSCEPEAVTNRQLLKKNGSLADLSGRILDQDFLSPLESGLLFSDLLQAFLPVRVPLLDRSRALDRSLEESFDNPTDVSGNVPARTADKANLLTQAFIWHWNANASWPALLLNTTDVQTGRRRVMAPFLVGEDTDQLLPVWPGEVLAGTKLSTGAFLSARFPWVTPSAWFKDLSGGVTYLVDGGYYDNSGLATAQEIMRGIDQAGLGSKIATKLIILTGAPSEPEPVGGLNEMLDPIRAMLNTWSARPVEAIRSADRSLNMSAGSPRRVRIVRLRGLLYGLPLGWRLSGGTTYLIDAEDPVLGLCDDDAGEGSPHGLFDADCLLRDLKGELL